MSDDNSIPIITLHDKSRFPYLFKPKSTDNKWIVWLKDAANVAWTGGILSGIVAGLQFLSNNILPPDIAVLVNDFFNIVVRDSGLG